MVKYKINGKYVTQEEWDSREGAGLSGGAPMGTVAYTESDPLLSDGLGCMKAQVPEMRETIKKHNIQGVRVRNDGQLEITSRSGRAKLLKVRGLVDAEGGYSD